MSDERTLKKNANIFNSVPFFYLIIEIFLYLFYDLSQLQVIGPIILKLKSIFIFQDGNILYSHLLGLLLIAASSVGTKPKKSIEISVPKHVMIPIALGLLMYFSALAFYAYDTDITVDKISPFEITFMITTIVGAVLINLGCDNVSKIIRIGFMKDKFNVENESFDQPIKPYLTDFSLNLPMSFHNKGKTKKGWFNLTNPFRGTLVIGTPESGKTYSIIIPFLKNFIQKNFTSITYDYKYPDLTNIAYYEHLKNKRTNPNYKHGFHVINLNDVAYSKRVNPLAPQYVEGLADCMETAEALVQSLQKTISTQGADKFFQLSAINFLAGVFFFLSRFEQGKYSTLPHALSFINRSYDEIFAVLLKVPELDNIMTPFKDALKNKAYGQLEGQLGTLRVNMSPLATPELFWVFSKEEFDLRISSSKNPAHLIIANSVQTESTNSTSNALILNRLTKLINTKGNLPSAVIVDELPTIYFHKIQSLIATARSNKVAVILGLQELPQLVESYNQNVANTITSVIGNVISGQARKKETLDWLQQLFGKVKQVKHGVSINKQDTTTSINEHMDFLIPASKIADQRTGEIVAKLAFGFNQKNSSFENSNTYNCRIEIDSKSVKREEASFQPLPKYKVFKSKQDQQRILTKNMNSIKADIEYIIQQAS